MVFIGIGNSFVVENHSNLIAPFFKSKVFPGFLLCRFEQSANRHTVFKLLLELIQPGFKSHLLFRLWGMTKVYIKIYPAPDGLLYCLLSRRSCD